MILFGENNSKKSDFVGIIEKVFWKNEKAKFKCKMSATNLNFGLSK